MICSRRQLILAMAAATTPSWVCQAFVVVVPIPSSRQHASSQIFAEESSKDESSGSTTGTTDILNSPEFLKRKLEVIKSDLAKAEDDIENAEKALEEGKAEWKDKFEDLQKERAILQDRMSKQSSDADGDATVEIAQAMVGVLDNFDRAFGIVKAEAEEEKAIEQQYRDAYESIIDVFGELGVRQVECVGQEFDYEQHSAVMTRMSDEYEEGTVMEELQKGFILAQKKQGEEEGEDIKLIRAAMVVVAA